MIFYSVDNGSNSVGFKQQEIQAHYEIYWKEYLIHDLEWYKTPFAIKIAENILLYQRPSGGWPKNIDMESPLENDRIADINLNPKKYRPTIDNGATYSQMRYLAKIYQVIEDDRYKIAFLKGLDYLLEAQYDNGGWPQFYPLRPGYYSHITFNDDAMIGVMKLLYDIVKNENEFHFVNDFYLQKVEQAIHKGIDCILKCQVRVGEDLTVWCAQYNEKSLQPAQGRSYELPSLSGKESVGIIQFLMEIENPDTIIIQAIKSAVNWFKKVQIEGIRMHREPDPSSPTGYNVVVVTDTTAPPIWARFYEIRTNKYFFCDRDGSIHNDLAELSSERRNEYGWLGYWPAALLADQYPRWQKKWSMDDKVEDY